MRYKLALILSLFFVAATAQNHIDTNTGANPFYVSRNLDTTETFRFSVGDRSGLMEYLQDEASGDHEWTYNISSSTTGNLSYRWRMNDEEYFSLLKGGCFLFNSNFESPTWRNQLKITSDVNSGFGIAFSGQGHHRGGIYAKNVGGSSNTTGEVTLWSRDGNIILDGLHVGIGTTTPTHKLEVEGTIRSKEVKVEAAPWPDYVFNDGYDLKSLEEIEAFIRSNNHLPEIPSAAEIEADGLKLGEMNRLLLKKIEELTLHLINEHKENENLREQVVTLEARSKKLKEENSTFKIQHSSLNEALEANNSKLSAISQQLNQLEKELSNVNKQ